MTRYRPFRKKKNFVLPIVLICLAVFLSVGLTRDLLGLRPAVLTIIYPGQWLVAVVWRGAVSVPLALIDLTRLAQQNSELKEKLAINETTLLRQTELASENQRLRQALNFSATDRWGGALLPARIIGKGAAPGYSLYQIGKGANNGVKVNQPVVVKAGLVGRVMEVSPWSAKVLSLLDPRSSVAAVVQRSRAYGSVDGFSPNYLRLNYVALSGDVQVGDQVVTSDISSFFPTGIPIGTVTKAERNEAELFYHLQIKPAVDFSALEIVFVVL